MLPQEFNIQKLSFQNTKKKTGTGIKNSKAGIQKQEIGMSKTGSL